MTGLRAVLIPADDTKPAQVLEIADRHASTLAAAISCQWIATVRTMWLREHRLLMVVDEEGLLTHKPRNTRAACFYPGGRIVGDVLIVADGGEDMESLSGFQVAVVTAALPVVARS